ncbi:MAG: hypothetical protein F6J97_24280 [Leptolyngbya sp. SIO4C1]|nr:hypothetical protein [Leptolyngbya sp. SIO4C1]
MKLPELKQQTYRMWRDLLAANDAVVQPEQFKPEVRSMGDLRCKSTWQRALARFTALFYIDTCLEAWSLITCQLNFEEATWHYDIRHLIIDEFLRHPDGPDLICAGLEQLFSTDFTPQEQQQGYGFFRLVAEQPGLRTIVNTAEFDGRKHLLTGAA